MSIFRRTFMLKVIVSRSKVEPVSDHDVAQLDHGRNMCAKFELLPARSDGHPPACPARMKIIIANNILSLSFQPLKVPFLAFTFFPKINDDFF